MLSCKEFTELVTAYLERAMPRQGQLAFLEHLRGCKVCWRYLRQVRATARALSRVPSTPVSPAVKSFLLTQFHHWSPGT